jgi:Spy/CpxP family protein refolding chaperone
MKRVPTLLTVVALMACCAPLFSAAAQTVSHTSVKPKSAHGHKAPMRHDQLTLYPHGRPARRQSAYGYTRHRFDHPTPVHNTFMGVRRW